MRHAYLIITHNEFEVLQRLVSALDDERNDIYIHFDKKVKALPKISVSRSKLFILKNRIDVRWGTVRQIECEYTLWEEALKIGQYDYYHMISGVHYPLKRIEEIDNFFSGMNGQSVLMPIEESCEYQETLKLKRYNLFLKHYQSHNRYLKAASQFLWKSAIAVQRILSIYTNKSEAFHKSANWCSLNDECVKYLIENKSHILKKYRWSLCGDEYFVPSELLQSRLKGMITESDKLLHHKIGRANADTFTIADYDELIGSECLFARKFKSSCINIIDKLSL